MKSPALAAAAIAESWPDATPGCFDFTYGVGRVISHHRLLTLHRRGGEVVGRRYP